MNKAVSIYLDHDFYKKLFEMAEREERSLNWLINKILKKYVEDQDNYESK